MSHDGSSPSLSRGILPLAFLSGAAALIYQITWARQFHFAMGGSVYAVTAVLGSFMAGMALGSLLGAGLAPRLRRPLLMFGGLEGGIALFGFLFPLLFSASRPVFLFFQSMAFERYGDQSPHLLVTRFLLSFCLLVLPTAAMGLTTPVLARQYVPKRGGTGRAIGRLYAASSAGAVAGTLAAGFFLLPTFGLAGGCRFAALINGCVAVGAWFLHRRAVRSNSLKTAGTDLESSPSRRRPLTPAGVILLLGAALLGVAAMNLEIAWSRAFSLLFGSSVYAFTIVISAFIGGIALGSSVPSRVFDRWGARTMPAGVALAAASLSSIVVFAAGSRLPLAVLQLFWLTGGLPGTLYPLQLVLAGMVLLLPTFFTGAAFPLLTRSLAGTASMAPERALGLIYSVNTAAAVAGSLITGFILIPRIGVDRTALVGAALLGLAGLSVWALDSISGAKRPAAAGPVTAGLLLLAVIVPSWFHSWDMNLYTCGPFLHAGLYREMLTLDRRWESETEGRRGMGPEPAPIRGVEQIGLDELAELVRARGEIIFERQGAGSTVSVRRGNGGVLSLQINGKTDASTGGDMKLQVLTAHLPLLLHHDPQRVFLLGLASGITLGHVLRHPEVLHVECAEIASEVVAASRFFDSYSGAPLDDPRTLLRVEDGRNVLEARPPESYDVIICEPSNPWLEGMAGLFTVEFFHLCRSRLNPGGLCCQWLQSYALSVDDFKGIAASFRQAFPRATLWAERAAGGDYLLIGFNGDAKHTVPDPAELERRAAGDSICRGLAGIGIDGSTRLLAHLAADAESLARFSNRSVLITDNNIRLEFTAPLSLHRKTLADHLEALQPFRFSGDSVPDWLPLHRPMGLESFRRSAAAMGELEQSCLAALRDDLDGTVLHLEQSLSHDTKNPDGLSFLHSVAPALADRLISTGKPAGAAMVCRLYLDTIDGEDGTMIVLEGQALLAMGLSRIAVLRMKKAADLIPDNEQAANLLGMALYRDGNMEEAAAAFQHAADLDPEYADPRANLGVLLYEGGEIQLAEDMLSRALALDPSHATALNNLAVIMRRSGRPDEAISLYRSAISADPDRAEFYLNLGLLHEELGEPHNARDLYRELMKIHPDHKTAALRLKSLAVDDVTP